MIAYITENKTDRSGLRVVGEQIEKLKSEIDHYGELEAKLYRDMVRADRPQGI